MVFRHRSSDTKFAVECKYRSKWEINGNAPQIEWAEEHNIENYLQFSKERKMDVVIIIGIGETAEKPDEVYAAPLHALKKFTYARKKYLEQFRLTDPNGYYKFILSQHTVVNWKECPFLWWSCSLKMRNSESWVKLVWTLPSHDEILCNDIKSKDVPCLMTAGWWLMRITIKNRANFS